MSSNNYIIIADAPNPTTAWTTLTSNVTTWTVVPLPGSYFYGDAARACDVSIDLNTYNLLKLFNTTTFRLTARVATSWSG